jgi:hypothetical protein
MSAYLPKGIIKILHGIRKFFPFHPVTPECPGLQAGEEWNVENINCPKEAPSFRAGSNGVHSRHKDIEKDSFKNFKVLNFLQQLDEIMRGIGKIALSIKVRERLTAPLPSTARGLSQIYGRSRRIGTVPALLWWGGKSGIL